MVNQYSHFPYNDPKDARAKGSFIVHVLDPFLLIKIGAIPPVIIFNRPKNPHIIKDELIYEVMLSKTGNYTEIYSRLYSTVDWYNAQPFYKDNFTEFFYNLVDDKGANFFVSLYNYEIDEEFIWARHIYRVINYENHMINCKRICEANSIDIPKYPVINPEL